MSNKKKYLSYREAWERIEAALAGGQYFEAVTICESIISDRLLSYVLGVDPDSRLTPKSPFGETIKKWRQLVDAEDRELVAEVDRWREDRNRVVHGLVKTAPGRPTEDVADFIERARLAAETGKRLAREVSNWHRKQLRKAQRT